MSEDARSVLAALVAALAVLPGAAGLVAPQAEDAAAAVAPAFQPCELHGSPKRRSLEPLARRFSSASIRRSYALAPRR